MELDKILYKESSLRNFYNYTIKFPTDEKYIQRDFYVVDIIKFSRNKHYGGTYIPSQYVYLRTVVSVS
jgi:hypothetical protein